MLAVSGTAAVFQRSAFFLPGCPRFFFAFGGAVSI